jgi:hypothetical protein
MYKHCGILLEALRKTMTYMKNPTLETQILNWPFSEYEAKLIHLQHCRNKKICLMLLSTKQDILHEVVIMVLVSHNTFTVTMG